MMMKEIERFERLRTMAKGRGFALEKVRSRDGYKLTDLRGEGFGPTVHGRFEAIEDFLAKRETKTVGKT
jgi:hypothetical protein